MWVHLISTYFVGIATLMVSRTDQMMARHITMTSP